MSTQILSQTMFRDTFDSRGDSDPYASPQQSAALLKQGAEYRRQRIDAADMLTSDQAAALAGVSRVSIHAWAKVGRCIGIAHIRRGLKLPRWQFEPEVWDWIAQVAKALHTQDGWRLLSFFETPLNALDGKTPRQALEQGTAGDRIVALATADAH
ncbi:helix-turn-helix domain-containing protein [Pigmentiphaga aceris]|uniref:Helix-turn-helix domain-containing protein n=1 Tax=Pigmentiphaga aceris TaxID=1940612 RepID=A0A5C0B5S1_9BURK|nr:helix-turn-helix domain-containing protein [Pigmentiphaga aceris]QEI08680.1 helix-turn-helix domain-containing protein [Pigmentiphaga aceris]